MWHSFRFAVLILTTIISVTATVAEPLCLDGFCIGMSISDQRFTEVEWVTPDDARSSPCVQTTCKPDRAFRGYPPVAALAAALSLETVVGLPEETVLSGQNLAGLRIYRYECNPAPRGVAAGERRFLGIYRSKPTGYHTAIGLRLIGGGLRVYRIVRRFPYATKMELALLEQGVAERYGSKITVVDYLSSNAYSEVREKGTDGWFGRSELYNPSDPTDNKAELVLVDPATRDLLQASSWPESGKIEGLKLILPLACSRSMPLD